MQLLDPSLRKHDLSETFQSKELLKEAQQWVRDHQAQLRWDPERGSFVLKDDA